MQVWTYVWLNDDGVPCTLQKLCTGGPVQCKVCVDGKSRWVYPLRTYFANGPIQETPKWCQRPRFVFCSLDAPPAWSKDAATKVRVEQGVRVAEFTGDSDAGSPQKGHDCGVNLHASMAKTRMACIDHMTLCIACGIVVHQLFSGSDPSHWTYVFHTTEDRAPCDIGLARFFLAMACEQYGLQMELTSRLPCALGVAVPSTSRRAVVLAALSAAHRAGDSPLYKRRDTFAVEEWQDVDGTWWIMDRRPPSACNPYAALGLLLLHLQTA